MSSTFEDGLFESFFVASKSTRDERFDICKRCPFLTKFNRCKKCGCFMTVKTKLSLASCPVNKW